eukprot:322475_1
MNNTQQTKVFTVKELRAFAFHLNERLDHTRVKGVKGFDKYQRRVEKELQRLQEIKDENKEYSSTNIFYLTAIWNYCIEIGLNNIGAICKKIKYLDIDADKTLTVVVDIICDENLKWIKIKSKNPYSIQVDIIKGESRSNIFMVADNYIKAAKTNKLQFKTPKIEFVFTKGITSDVYYLLKTKGISIKGEIIKDKNILFDENENENEKTEEEEEEEEEELINETAVNLGPKTMMTMISSLSNNEIFDELWQTVENYVIEREDHPDSYKSTIYQQALNFEYNTKISHKIFSNKSTQMLSNMVGNYYEELQYPVMPIIMQYIGTKKLYCCQSAWQSVSKLVNMGAGQNELNRYKQLESQITIIPDQLSEKTKKLKGKSISNVNKAVFGTGDKLKMLTVAAVPTFVRKAKQKGVNYFCKLHDVRPFIEQYQIGFQIFKINKGFDNQVLKRTMEYDDDHYDDNDHDDDDDDEEDSEFENFSID